MESFENGLARLVQHRRRETDVLPFAFVPDFIDRKRRVNRIANLRRFEKAAALLDKNQSVDLKTRVRTAQCRHSGKQQTMRQRRAKLS